MEEDGGLDLIDEIVKIHDSYQFEIKFTYQPEEKAKRTRYAVETYVFLPKSLGIDPASYPRTKFYEDVKSYVRLKTPTVLLKNLSGKNSPLDSLEKSVDNLAISQCQANSSDFEYRIKMFCSILKSCLRDEVAFIEKHHDAKDVEDNISDLLDNLKNLAKDFRKLSRKIKVPSIPEKFIALYEFADEYTSIISNECRHEIFDILRKYDIRRTSSISDKILEQAKEEISHRKECGYPSIPAEDGDNEEMTFRRSALKKIMGRILFLNRKTSAGGFLAEQMLFGISAGLAMAFATAVAFMSRDRIGEFSTLFFLLLVAAYIFKDRMKDILKTYFSNLVRKFFADRKTKIYSNLGQKIGFVKESFSFTDERELPRQIASARGKDPISDVHEGAYGENIILYRKDIMLISKNFGKIFPDFKISGINDITRFNIFRFLQRMDNPREDNFIPKKNDYLKVAGSRVYHVNIVIKNIAGTNTTTSRIRLVLTREGIKRIEEVK